MINSASNPPHWNPCFERQHHIYDCDRPEMIPLLRDIRQVLDSYSDRYAIGETFQHSPRKAAMYCAPGLLRAAFDFSFLECPWKPARFLSTIQRWEEALHEESWPTYVLETMTPAGLPPATAGGMTMSVSR